MALSHLHLVLNHVPVIGSVIAAILPVMPVVASRDADLPAPKDATMLATWLSTMRPADAARKKTVKSFQDVACRLL
jgi:hypothetical protein